MPFSNNGRFKRVYVNLTPFLRTYPPLPTERVVPTIIAVSEIVPDTIFKVSPPTDPQALDPEARARLIALSAELTGVPLAR